VAKKPTIARDSVFRSTGRTPPSIAQGKATDAPTHQTAVWLGDAETEWLDRQCQEVRRGGWRGVTRSALIRALIRAAMERTTDFAGVSGEDDLTQRLG
jgi:hypothetical protein